MPPNEVMRDASKAKRFTLTIVRHGQTLANIKKNIQGHSDTPLSELGRLQAEALGRHFCLQGPRHFDRVYSSDLGRAKETCQIILSLMNEFLAAPGAEQLDGAGQPRANQMQQILFKKGSIKIKLDERLRERKYGARYESKPVRKLQEEAYEMGYDSTNFTNYTPAGAESMEQVKNRLLDFYFGTLCREVEDGEEVLLVSHWALIKEFLKLFAPCSRGAIKAHHIMEAPNSSYSRFKITCDTGALLGHDEPHYPVLEEEEEEEEELEELEELEEQEQRQQQQEAAKKPMEVKVICLHQTQHLDADQVSVNLRQRLE